MGRLPWPPDGRAHARAPQPPLSALLCALLFLVSTGVGVGADPVYDENSTNATCYEGNATLLYARWGDSNLQGWPPPGLEPTNCTSKACFLASALLPDGTAEVVGWCADGPNRWVNDNDPRFPGRMVTFSLYCCADENFTHTGSACNGANDETSLFLRSQPFFPSCPALNETVQEPPPTTCAGNFAGPPGCGYCKPGFWGANCSKAFVENDCSGKDSESNKAN
ncbi:hypothetical protein T484DRAFT_1821940 [Baffinella frigidus]|nr:hypothetical protein T484DRAFT_1821940 [Cryptophyta sp. CCMP2293]